MDHEETAATDVSPHSIKAEEALIGGILLDAEAWQDAGAHVLAEDFHYPPHQLVFRVVTEMLDAGRPVDLVTLSEELSDRSFLGRVGGADYLAALVERIGRKPGRPNMAAYARIVRHKATLRGLVDAGKAIATSAAGPEARDADVLLDDAERRILALRRNRGPDRRPRRAAEVAVRIRETLQRQAKQERGPTGVATGLLDLDAITGGFQPSQLVVIAGRPGMGKSTLLTNIAGHAVLDDARDPRPVLLFSLDEPAGAVASRLLSSLGRIDLNFIRNGLPDHEWEKLGDALRRLTERPLYLEDSPQTANGMRLRARQVARETGRLKMILVDSLQRIRPEAACERLSPEDLEPSWSLKTLAREMQCPVVATSALNRGPERRGTKRPELSDLRGSGAIEQDADIVLLMYREEMYRRDSDLQGQAEIRLAKHPAASPASIQLRFIGRWARFVDLHADHVV